MTKVILTNEDQDFLIYDLEQEQITYQAGKTKQLDSKTLKGQGRTTFRPFGITQDQNWIYIASNDKLGRFKKDTFEFVGLIDLPLWINTHQILYDAPNETMYTCNTAIDTVGIYHPDCEDKQLSINYMTLVEQKLQPKFADQLDSRHVNTLYDAGEYIMFVRHNRNITNSDIGFFDKRTQSPRIAFSIGRCCHGIAVIENTLYTLSTATGELIAIDLIDKSAVRYKIADPKVSFLRGLDVDGNKLLIGSSVNQKNKDLSGSEHAKIFEVDVVNKTPVKEHNLIGIKIINDLKVLIDGKSTSH